MKTILVTGSSGLIGSEAVEHFDRQGYRVIGWSARAAALEGLETRHGDSDLPEVLRAADIVINLLPLTPATRGLFDAQRFAQMRTSRDR